MRFSSLLRRTPLLVALATAAGCKGSGDATPAASSSATAASVAAPSATIQASAVPTANPLRGRPKTDKELPTTAGSIAIPNMDGQVVEMARLANDPYAKAHPTLYVSRLHALSGAHHTQGKHRGDLDEIQLGIDEMTKCIALEPKNGDYLLDRAGQEQSLHRFKEARADLAKARDLGANPDAIAAVEQELDWNDGQYEKATTEIHIARKKQATMMTVAREAQLAHDLGAEDEADRLFEQAEDLVHDTSPIPVGWLNVQRGLHKLHTGKLEDAVLFYREAVARVPTFLMAREHLAEALHLLGKDDEATSIYEDIVKHSDDPEFMGALASLYREHGKAKEADALKAKATARYGELLKKYPEAMYWHASEYFMGEGADPKKALDLLQKNLELRPNSGSYVALARAELANGDAEGAKAHVSRALGMPIQSAELYWTAARVFGKLGDSGKRDEYAAKAKAFNPVIEKTEPGLDAR